MWGIRPLYFSLEDYGSLIGVSESALYGLKRDGDPETGCDGYYWNQTERYQFGHAFGQAERQMYRYLKHPINRTWICQERHPFNGCDLYLRNRWVIAIGDKTEEAIEDDVDTGIGSLSDTCEMRIDEFSIPNTNLVLYTSVPSLQDIPSSVLSVTTDVTDCSEIVLYYPDQTKWEVKPVQISITGGVATIIVPRTRFLKQQYLKDYPKNDPNSRPLYEDDNNFLATIDVHRRFPDETEAVTFVWYRKSCGCTCSCTHTSTVPGDIVTQTGRAVIVDSKSGRIRVEPATFNTTTGLWEAATWTECRAPDEVRVSYVAGLPNDCDNNCPTDTDEELVRAIISLGHSNLPRGFCSCSAAAVYFEMDSKIPSPEQGVLLSNPLGLTYGSNIAWQIVKRRAGAFGGLLA